MSFTNITLSNIGTGEFAYLAFDNENGFRLFKEVSDNDIVFLHDISSDPPVTATRLLTSAAIIDNSLVTDLNSSNAFDGFEEIGQIIKIDESWYNVNSHLDDNNVTVDRNLSFNSVVRFSGASILPQSLSSLQNGDRVVFTTTGLLPSPLSTEGIYYVVSATSTGFGVSLTPGGADITTSGTVAGQNKIYKVHNVYSTTYLPNQLIQTLIGRVVNTAGVYTLEPFYSVNDSNVTPISIVTSLPAVGEYVGQVVINSSDNNIYTWNGAAWVTSTSTSSRSVRLGTTAQAFSYSSNGDTPDPASATLTAVAFNAEGTVYYEFIVDGSTVQNTVSNTYTYIPQASLDNMPDVIEVKIREGSTITPVLASDQITCFGVAPGSDAITIVLSNEAHTLPSDSDGNNVDFTGSGTTIRVYRGNQLVPYSAALASDPSFKVTLFSSENVTAGSITGTGTTVTVAPIAAMSANRGSLIYDVTVLSEGSETVYQKVQSFAKSRAGVPGAGGANAITLQLVANDYSIIYDTSNANPAPSNFTLTAVAQNVSTPYYTFRESSSTGTILQASSTDSDLVITSPTASFTPAKTYWVGVAASAGGTILAYDTISVFSVRQSLDGENAYTVIVSNEAHTVPATSTGSVTSYANSGTRIECFVGATELQRVTGTPGAGQFSVSASGTDITPGAISTSGLTALVADHSSMTQDVATVTYTINLENVATVEKVQSLTKSRQGAAGSLGTGAAVVKLDVVTYAIAYAADGTTPNPSGTLTLTATAQNIDTPWFKFTATPTIGGFDEGTFTVGTGDTDSKTFTIPSTFFSAPYKFRVDVSDGDQAGLAFDTISVYAVRPGLNAITGFLTNEAHTVATAFDGTGASYTTAGGTFTVFNGVTNVTTSSTFSIDGGTDGGATWTKVQNGLTLTINETTGIYSLSGGSWTSDAESFILRAVHNGVTIDKTYTITKSKAGLPNLSYFVTSSSDVIKKNANGTLTPVNITFNAFSQTGTSNPVSYSGRFRVYRNEVLVYSSASNESAYTYTPADPATLTNVRVELYQGGGFTTLFDNEAIAVVQDGIDAITVSVDNENVSFPGPATGFSGINFGTSTSTIRVYNGTTLLNYAGSGANTWSATVAATGVTVAAGVGSGTTYVVPVPTAMSSVNAYTDVTLTIRNAAGIATTQVVRITYTLARSGVDSTSYWLVTSADALKRALNNSLTPASVTFTAYSAVGAGAPALYAGRFIVRRNGNIVYTSTVNETSYTYTPADPATLTSITGELYLAGGTTTKVDEEGIAIVLDGADSYTVSVDNENNTYPAPATGFAGIGFNAATSTIRVFRGSNQLAYNTSGANTFSCSTAATNVTVAAGSVGGGNSFIVPVPTAMTSDTGFVDVTVTIRDSASAVSTQNVKITYSLARNGAQGPNGLQGATGAPGSNTAIVSLYAKNTSSVTPPTAFTGTGTYTFSTGALTGMTLGTWTTTVPTVAAGEFLWVRQAIATSNTSTDTIAIGEWSAAVVLTNGAVNGLNSASIFLYAKNTSGVTAPTAFTGTGTYTFSTNALTGMTLNTWSRTAPSLLAGEFLWVRQAVASSTTNTDTILIGEWSAAVVAGIGGTQGTTGGTGTQGVQGTGGTQGTTGPTGTQARIAYAIGASNFVFSGANTVVKNGETFPASGVVLPFNFASSAEGFTAGGAGSSAVGASGILTWAAAATDSNLVTPTIGRLGSTIPKIRARIRCISASPTWEGVVYYSTGGHGYSGSFFKSIAAPATPLVQNTWYTVEWDMALLSAGGNDWLNSTINNVRFDISNNISTWEIDWIAFGTSFVPDALPGSGDWGLATTWFGSPQPLVTTGTSLYQVTGLYNPATGTTTWTGYPYLSALKVGELSAITANLGTVTAGVLRSGTVVNAGSFSIGQKYVIESTGTTNFTLIGASSNTVGLLFTATGVGSGTGTALTAARTVVGPQGVSVYDSNGVLRVRLGEWT